MKLFDFSKCSTLEEFFKCSMEWAKEAYVEDYTAYLEEIQGLMSECSSYRELGTMQGISAAAAILANPRAEISMVDINFNRIRPWLHLFPKMGMEEVDSRIANQKECDLLFIDSRHNPFHLQAELSRHGAFVKKFIVAHDTKAIPTLRPVLEEFAGLRRVEHDERGAGHTTIWKF